MSDIRRGGCRCGAARYEVNLTQAHTINCHCRDCQQHLGAPFSIFSVVPADQFRWITAPTGHIRFSNTADRLFCTDCGTYLKWEGKDSEDEAEFNTMTLDDPSNLQVDVEIFTRTRLPWISPLPKVRQFQAGRSGS